MDNQLNIVASQGYQLAAEKILTSEAEDAIMANKKYTTTLTALTVSNYIR
ncbi:MAG: hypothetical protein U5N58_02415 [Actinomycetota bacterium]|nr:hypothetical protein [Actinomycetota bacterium]